MAEPLNIKRPFHGLLKANTNTCRRQCHYWFTQYLITNRTINSINHAQSCHTRDSIYHAYANWGIGGHIVWAFILCSLSISTFCIQISSFTISHFLFLEFTPISPTVICNPSVQMDGGRSRWHTNPLIMSKRHNFYNGTKYMKSTVVIENMIDWA